MTGTQIMLVLVAFFIAGRLMGRPFLSGHELRERISQHAKEKEGGDGLA